MAKTLFEKLWESHVVRQESNGPALIYIDLHLVHEVTTPQAFDGLRLAGRKVRAPERTIATVDHNVPTQNRSLTPREAARVQAIPDWFDLAPGRRAPKVTDLRRWIGNAVPPILAHAAVSALPLGSFPAE